MKPIGDSRVSNKSWQAIGIYTAPNAQSTIPDTMVEVPTAVFGQGAMLGTTGCQRFMAQVTYNDGEKAPADTIRTMRIKSIEFDPRASLANCTGDRLWAHNSLTRLYSADNVFDVVVDSNNQLILTLHDGRVDSPAIRFVSP